MLDNAITTPCRNRGTGSTTAMLTVTPHLLCSCLSSPSTAADSLSPGRDLPFDGHDSVISVMDLQGSAFLASRHLALGGPRGLPRQTRSAHPPPPPASEPTSSYRGRRRQDPIRPRGRRRAPEGHARGGARRDSLRSAPERHHQGHGASHSRPATPHVLAVTAPATATWPTE